MKTTFSLLLLSVLLFTSCSSTKLLSKFEEYNYISSSNALTTEYEILTSKSENAKDLNEYYKLIRRYSAVTSRANYIILSIDIKCSRGVFSRNSCYIEKHYKKSLQELVKDMDSLTVSMKGYMPAKEDADSSSLVVPYMDILGKGIEITEKINTSINGRREKIFSSLYIGKPAKEKE